MSDYSHTEIKDMQERALERVRAMQQRARETAEQAQAELSGSERTREVPLPSVSELLSEEEKRRSHHIHLPTELPRREPQYPSFREFFGEEDGPLPKKEPQKEKSGALKDLLKEPERAILFPLLLLLRSEGADEALLMSLLYIMT